MKFRRTRTSEDARAQENWMCSNQATITPLLKSQTTISFKFSRQKIFRQKLLTREKKKLSQRKTVLKIHPWSMSNLLLLHQSSFKMCPPQLLETKKKLKQYKTSQSSSLQFNQKLHSHKSNRIQNQNLNSSQCPSSKSRNLFNPKTNLKKSQNPCQQNYSPNPSKPHLTPTSSQKSENNEPKRSMKQQMHQPQIQCT